MERWIENLINETLEISDERTSNIIRCILYEVSEINDRLKELENK